MDQDLPAHISWTVPSGRKAVRLDAFVRRCLPHLSQREVKRAIEQKGFWIHGRPGKKGETLHAGDVVAFRGSERLLALSPLPSWEIEAAILYEDGSVLALDKPAGMATHGFSGGETKAMANYLAAIRPSLARAGKGRWECGLVHRLDRDTSGVVLAAKERAAYEDLRSQFRRGLVKKRYWALVWGETGEEGVVDYPLIHDPKDRRKMRAVLKPQGRGRLPKRWKALTRFRRVACGQGFSLLDVEIETGVTHQIRVHLDSIGHPIVGDPLYAKGRPDPFGLGRQFLHAYLLGFRHPGGGQDVTVTSPLPAELRRVLDSLKIGVEV